MHMQEHPSPESQGLKYKKGREQEFIKLSTKPIGELLHDTLTKTMDQHFQSSSKKLIKSSRSSVNVPRNPNHDNTQDFTK